MDRGPLALFAAIVAVGLGPAMWLGAQFGRIEVAPSQPPAYVGEQRSQSAKAVGGSGAQDTSAGHNSTIRTTPQAHVLPLTTRRPAAAPSTGATTNAGSASASSAAPASSPPSHLGEPSSSPSQSPEPSDDGQSASASESPSPLPSDTTDDDEDGGKADRAR
jgi:hypothetical protein